MLTQSWWKVLNLWNYRLMGKIKIKDFLKSRFNTPEKAPVSKCKHCKEWMFNGDEGVRHMDNVFHATCFLMSDLPLAVKKRGIKTIPNLFSKDDKLVQMVEFMGL